MQMRFTLLFTLFLCIVSCSNSERPDIRYYIADGDTIALVKEEIDVAEGSSCGAHWKSLRNNEYIVINKKFVKSEQQIIRICEKIIDDQNELLRDEIKKNKTGVTDFWSAFQADVYIRDGFSQDVDSVIKGCRDYLFTRGIASLMKSKIETDEPEKPKYFGVYDLSFGIKFKIDGISAEVVDYKTNQRVKTMCITTDTILNPLQIDCLHRADVTTVRFEHKGKEYAHSVKWTEHWHPDNLIKIGRLMEIWYEKEYNGKKIYTDIDLWDTGETSRYDPRVEFIN